MVIKYTIKHKHPQFRSAFTYCEDELPSRIDFGKSKYGGPFTTEQVEDVKTFLRCLPLISIFGMLASAIVASGYLKIYLARQYNHFSGINLNGELASRKTTTECYTNKSLANSVYLSMTLLIVINEFVIYPLCHRHMYFRGIKSLWKIVLGTALQIVRITVLMTFDIISRQNFLNYSEHHNETILCIFIKKTWLTKPIFQPWMVGHSRVLPLHLPDLHSHRHCWIYLLASPLLHERCDNWSTVHLDVSLPSSQCGYCSAVQTSPLHLGWRNHQLWILVCSGLFSCQYLHFHCTNMDSKAIQDA